MLIVDDLEKWRLSLVQLFEEWSEIVLEVAACGNDALALLSEREFDLVLLDLRMPSGKEGFQILSEIKTLRPKTQVIMMSAFGDIPAAVEALKLGALDFIPKAADFDDVIVFRVHEFIRNSQLIADRELLIHLKYKEVFRSKTARQKGQALEDLIAALLASIEGFIKIGQNLNTQTEEIDVAFRNGSRDPSWQKESEIIAVECKNWWSRRVGKNEFVIFKEKIANRAGRCRLGFLICVDAFAETVTKEMLRSSKTDVLVVPIDGMKLDQLVKSENRNQLLLEFVTEAALI